MVMAGLRAIGEIDIKKIIALSTLSQLGLIFLTLGIGLPALTFFHLVAHAYFKAIIFICAGGVIHRINDYQDVRMLGLGRQLLPVSSGVFLLGSLRLCGIPFITGFYSKDLILELIIIRETNIFIFLVAMLATFLTVSYSLRLLNLTFFRGVSIRSRIARHEGGYLIVGIRILIIPAAIGGLGISWLIPRYRHLIFLPVWLKRFILIIILGAILSIKKSNKSKFSEAQRFFSII